MLIQQNGIRAAAYIEKHLKNQSRILKSGAIKNIFFKNLRVIKVKKRNKNATEYNKLQHNQW